jgi:uncharacterized alkaline shock family protein YloU
MNQESGKVATKDRPATEVPRQHTALEKSGKASHGNRTTIADAVVAKIAGMAAREVGGVYAMGAGVGRTFGSVKERMGMNKNVAQGVAVEVGERQTAIDIDVVVDYGVSIPNLANAIRENVVKSVEHMCGLEVVEVNVAVDDIHLPGEEAEQQEPSEPRVQ